jgi:hypothetical protein
MEAFRPSRGAITRRRHGNEPRKRRRSRSRSRPFGEAIVGPGTEAGRAFPSSDADSCRGSRFRAGPDWRASARTRDRSLAGDKVGDRVRDDLSVGQIGGLLD